MAAIPGGNLIDGSAAATGADQTVFTQNTSRQYLLIQNVGANDLWVNFGIAAVAAQPSIKLVAGASLELNAPGVVPTGAVHVIGTAAQPFVAKQA